MTTADASSARRFTAKGLATRERILRSAADVLLEGGLSAFNLEKVRRAASVSGSQGKYQERVAGAAIGARPHRRPLDVTPWSAHAATADELAVPQAFFTDTEAGSGGLTSRQAKQRGHRVRVVDLDMGESVPGANFYADGYSGRARMVVDEDDGHLLCDVRWTGGGGDASFSHDRSRRTGPDIASLWHAVPCFPTISEVWLRLLEAYRDGQGSTA